MQSSFVHLTFAGPPGELPVLVDLTMTVPQVVQAAQGDMWSLDAFLQHSLEHDEPESRETVSVPKLDATAPVQVFRRSLLNSSEDSRSCVICCEDFRPRKHVRRLPCGHMFCSKCISKWVLKQSATCPTCRCSLTEQGRHSQE